MLPHIERRQVETERLDPPQQPLDVEQPGIDTLVGAQAERDESDVLAKLVGVLVTVGASLVRAAQPLADLCEEYAIRHAVMSRRSDGARSGQQPHVLLEALAELGGRRHAARALRQPLRELLAFGEVAVQDHLVVACESLADGLGVHVGVAVHVAAGPGAEVQDGGQAQRAGTRAVDLLERLGDLLVERRHDAVENLHQVEQQLLALIRHREPLARQLLGLPRRGELHADVAPDVARLVRRQARVEPLEQPLRDALLLAQQRTAARLGGVRREHRLDRERADQLEHLLLAETRAP